MEGNTVYIFICAFLIFILVLSGVALRRAGKPYKNLVLTLHKITTVATIAIVWITISRINHNSGIIPASLIVMVIIALLSFISGVLQSFPRDASKSVTLTHKITSYLVIVLIVLELTEII